MSLHFEQYSTSQINNKHEKLVILLHGYGSNAKDLIALAPELSKAIPNALFISPNAPFPYEGGNIGAFQWYSLINRSSESILKGFKLAFPILEKLINEQTQRMNINYSDVILIGFSQGGMMALQSSLTLKKRINCAISFSGYIIDYPDFENDILSRPPLLMIHGDRDTVVPFTAFKNSQECLARLNLEVETYTAEGLGHGIDNGGIQKALEFLKKHV